MAPKVAAAVAPRLTASRLPLHATALAGQIRPSRQTALFSATFRGKVERLASDATRNPVRIVVGVAGQSAAAVVQVRLALEHEGGGEATRSCRCGWR